MTANTLYPGYFLMFYTVAGLEHKATLPVSSNLAGTGQPNASAVMRNSGNTIDAYNAMLAYCNQIRPLFHTSVSFDRWELYAIDSPGGDAVFVDTDDIGVAGTSTINAVLAVQMVAIARTSKGGIAKPTFLECSANPNSRFLSPTYGGSGPLTTLSNWLKGPEGWIIGRDGGRITQVTKFTSKTNDLLRKRRLLV